MFDHLVDSGGNGKTKKSITFTVSIIVHAVLIVFLVILPLLFPDTLAGSIQQLTFLVAPPPPPPPPPPPAPAEVVRRVVQVVDDAFTVPVEIPKDVLMIVDEGPPPDTVIGGVVGGVPGGVPGAGGGRRGGAGAHLGAGVGPPIYIAFA